MTLPFWFCRISGDYFLSTQNVQMSENKLNCFLLKFSFGVGYTRIHGPGGSTCSNPVGFHDPQNGAVEGSHLYSKRT